MQRSSHQKMRDSTMFDAKSNLADVRRPLQGNYVGSVFRYADSAGSDSVRSTRNANRPASSASAASAAAAANSRSAIRFKRSAGRPGATRATIWTKTFSGCSSATNDIVASRAKVLTAFAGKMPLARAATCTPCASRLISTRAFAPWLYSMVMCGISTPFSPGSAASLTFPFNNRKRP